MASIALPRRMIVGGGTHKQAGSLIKQLNLSKPLIVSDPFLAENGTVDKICKSMDEAGVSYSIFTDTIPDPTTDSVDKVVRKLEETDTDCLFAVGGGSPMDTAKAAAVLSVHKGHMRDYKAPFQMDTPGLPVLACPTTSGTGSEVTKFTIITDSETEEKMLCIGLAYLPVAAVVDYELTLSMPWRLSADSGIDALCHAMEAFVSAKRNPFSQSLALASLSKISENIRQVCYDPENHQAREAMMLASTEAGMAFSNASVTLIHGMSRPIGALFHVPHGLSNALLAPKLTKFSVGGAVSEYANCSRAMGMCDTGISDEDAAEQLPKSLYDLNNELKVPLMKDFIDKDQFMKSVPKMAEAALSSGSPSNNPIVPTQAEIEQLYVDIYEGRF